jgi:hypothetical protein
MLDLKILYTHATYTCINTVFYKGYILVRKPRGKLGIDMKIILMWILKKQDVCGLDSGASG